MVGTRGSPKIHHDGPESFPVAQQPTTNLDPNRLRRLSFGVRGGAAKNMLPARERGGQLGPLVPLPIERPKFHHGEARQRLPKASYRDGRKPQYIEALRHYGLHTLDARQYCTNTPFLEFLSKKHVV